MTECSERPPVWLKNPEWSDVVSGSWTVRWLDWSQRNSGVDSWDLSSPSGFPAKRFESPIVLLCCGEVSWNILLQQEYLCNYKTVQLSWSDVFLLSDGKVKRDDEALSLSQMICFNRSKESFRRWYTVFRVKSYWLS